MNVAMTLKQAICIYQENNAAFCTLNAVTRVNGLPTVGPGRPLSRQAISRLVQKLSGHKQLREIYPERLIYVDSVRMAWWSPAQMRPIYFRTRCKTLNRTLGGAIVRHPALMFVADPGRLSVYALADESRPTADTKLYVAPYYNIYDGGMMCAGNIRLPETISPSDIAAWEDGFYNTEFTHSNMRGLTRHPHRHAGFWWDMRRLAEVPFLHDRPVVARYLTPTKLTAGQAINK